MPAKTIPNDYQLPADFNARKFLCDLFAGRNVTRADVPEQDVSKPCPTCGFVVSAAVKLSCSSCAS